MQKFEDETKWDETNWIRIHGHLPERLGCVYALDVEKSLNMVVSLE